MLNKAFNIIILAIFLGIIIICYKEKKSNKKKLSEYFNPRNVENNIKINLDKKPSKSILKTPNCKNKDPNRRVSFILPEEKDYSFLDVEKMDIPLTPFQEPSVEYKNKASEQANKLCMNNKLDNYDSYPSRLEKIKNCEKVNSAIPIQDVFDSLIVDYKRNINPKTLSSNQENIESGAFGLSSFTNNEWQYINESQQNGGKSEDGLYANDPGISNEAIINP